MGWQKRAHHGHFVTEWEEISTEGDTINQDWRSFAQEKLLLGVSEEGDLLLWVNQWKEHISCRRLNLWSSTKSLSILSIFQHDPHWQWCYLILCAQTQNCGCFLLNSTYLSHRKSAQGTVLGLLFVPKGISPSILEGLTTLNYRGKGKAGKLQ